MFGFCATSLSAIFWHSLLPFEFFVPVIMLLAIILYYRVWLLSGAIISLLWLSVYSHFLLSFQTKNDLNELKVKAEIISLVTQNSDWLSADIALIQPNVTFLPRKKLRISWRTTQTVKVGQVYQWQLKPKSITGILNKGGFNQQKYYLSRHIFAKANVKSAELTGEQQSLRQQLLFSLSKALGKFNNSDLMLALLLGDKSQFSNHRWETLRQSGTGHLVAISGLHLSVISAWLFLCSFWFMTRLRQAQGKSNLVFAIVVSCFGALFYAYLAGFAIATQRALIMLLVVMGLALFRRFSSPWERLLMALFVILIIDPLAVLSAGLWLSFTALTLILLSISHYQKSRSIGKNTYQKIRVRLKQFILIQLCLSIGLGLLGALLFGGMSVHSIWVNLLVVPWFSVVVIPLAFISLIIWCVGRLLGLNWDYGFELTDLSLQPFSWIVEQVHKLPFSWVHFSEVLIIPSVLFLIAIISFAIIHKTQYKWMSLILMLPLLFNLGKILISQSNSWNLHLLDVGQGLAVVVEKNGKGFIYDTGAAYGESFSYAERAIVPFLNSVGLTEIDHIVISHSDNDHAGGLAVLRKQFPNSEIIANAEKLDPTQNCYPKQFEWQGLEITILWPNSQLEGNDGSCVIKITDGRNSVLLPGDIEQYAEYSLLNDSSELKSDVLIAPHHGSRTSSSPEFVKAVSPELLLVPAGFNNRYGFPKQEIMQRYKNINSEIVVSGLQGQITVTFDENGYRYQTYRSDFAPYWYNQLFKFGELND
ncbi:DNA internalization-related competence protein ComEC/Rec2 [Parashewanella spongiae]|nr:DNA internalization-related competence protein ComEC/Rec2 [Parashewanella spongiae]MCL1077577.1 DNA internalization-related competence protein ComEC/Rec2 [Parashewanella spongiae]